MGKGVSFAEGKASYHYWTPSEEELETAHPRDRGGDPAAGSRLRGGAGIMSVHMAKPKPSVNGRIPERNLERPFRKSQKKTEILW